VPSRSTTRCFVDEVQPVLFETRQGFREIRDPVCDVMESLAPTLQEASNGSFGAERFHELDGPDEEDPDALSRQFLRRGTGPSCQEFEKRRGLLEGGDGHGDVVQRIRKHIFGAFVRAKRAPEDA